MQTQNELETRFQDDINHIVKNLIEDYGLRYQEKIEGLSNPLLRWLDFVTRYIPPVPRKIIVSNKFPKKLCSDTESALHNLEKLIQNGGDINPYQSKGLILSNDTSGNKRQQRTDLLFADWEIHHLHLTKETISPGSYFSIRSDWLLFCMISNDIACFIDVKHHKDDSLFSDPELIKTVFENWPEIMEFYRINCISLSGVPRTPQEIATLRKNGISSFNTINNNVYMEPGMGLTSASTPDKLSMMIFNINKYLIELAKIVFDPTGQFKKESDKAGITDPEFSITLTIQGLSVFEENEKKAFVLPRAINAGEKDFLVKLHDLIAPV